MLVNIACLDGNCNDVAHARVLAVIKRHEINNIYDIGEVLAKVYTDPKCPYPVIGTVEADRFGIIKPHLCDKFFWITVAPNGPVIIDDFGAGRNRLDRFHFICAKAAKNKTSIWDFANEWKNTHHKSSIEALVHGYVHYVTMACLESDYCEWLGATGVFDKPPYDCSDGNCLCVGLDVSSMDTTCELSAILEDHYFKHMIKKHDLTEEARGRQSVTNFMFYKGLAPNLLVGNSPRDEYISPEKVENIKKMMLAYCAKIAH